MKPDGIAERDRRIIIGVIHSCVPNAKIYLFGSRATGAFRDRSDVDIAIDAGNVLARHVVGEIKDMLNASNIPFKIDVVDFHSVSDEMRSAINNEGVLWNV